MDKAGRRPLLLYPMIVMTIDMGIITIALWLQPEYTWLSYISIICVIVYVICFSVGLGMLALSTVSLFSQYYMCCDFKVILHMSRSYKTLHVLSSHRSHPAHDGL